MRQRQHWALVILVGTLALAVGVTLTAQPQQRIRALSAPRADGPLINPQGIVTFTASADHAVIDNYVVGYFLTGAVAPALEVDVGKPAPDNTQLCTVTVSVTPLPFGDYVAKAKAVASSGVSSDWSEASNPFRRAPLPPGAPVVR